MVGLITQSALNSGASLLNVHYTTRFVRQKRIERTGYVSSLPYDTHLPVFPAVNR